MMNVFLDLREIIRRQTEGKVLIQLATPIERIVGRGLDSVDWVYILIALEILHHKEIPENLVGMRAGNFMGLAMRIADLPRDPDRLFGAERILMLNQAVHQTFTGDPIVEGWKKAS